VLNNSDKLTNITKNIFLHFRCTSKKKTHNGKVVRILYGLLIIRNMSVINVI
jgi:hypothetical protein